MEQVILVVEDEPLIGMEIQEQLERSGYLVPLVAQNGEEAISAVAQVNPDLIMLDIRLPGPLDGIETARRIQAEHDIPILYLTAFSDELTVSRAGKTAPDAYLVKPFSEKELLANINIAIAKHHRKQAGSATLSSYTTVVDAVTEPTILFDNQGRVFHFNLAASRLFGMPDAAGFNGYDLADFLGIYEEDENGIVPGTYPLVQELSEKTNPMLTLRLESLTDRNGIVRGYLAALTECQECAEAAPEINVLDLEPGISLIRNNCDMFSLSDIFPLGKHVSAFYFLDHSNIALEQKLLAQRIGQTFRSITHELVSDLGTHIAPLSILTTLNRRYRIRHAKKQGFDMILAVIDHRTGEWSLARSGSPRCFIQQAKGIAIAIATHGTAILSGDARELETANGTLQGTMRLTLCAKFKDDKSKPGLVPPVLDSGITVALAES